MGTTVIEFTNLTSRRAVEFENLAVSFIQRIGQDLSLLVAILQRDLFECRHKCEVFTERIPAEVVFGEELLHLLRSRSTCTSFIEATTSHERHDGEHLCRSTNFENREEVREVVTHHVTRHTDSIEASLGALHRFDDSFARAHDLDVEALEVMFRQVGFDLLLDFAVVSAFRIEPEDSRRIREAGARYSELHPVTHRSVLGLAHAEDIASCDFLLQEDFALAVHSADNALALCDKRLVVAAVFFGALSHKAHVRHGTHRLRVECAVLLAEFNRFIVNTSVAAVRNAGDNFLKLAFLVPHAAGIANHGRHRSVDNHVARHMQIRNALGRIDHGEVRTCGECGVDGSLDFGFLGITFEALEQVTETVVGIDSEFLEEVSVLREHVLEEHADKCTEQHRVRDLHHRGLEVHGEEEALGLGFGHCIGDELFKRSHAHDGCIDDFALEERLCSTEFRYGTSFIDKFNLEGVGFGHRDGLFVAVEVIGLHARDISLHGFVPHAVAMRIVAGIVLDSVRSAAVGVALAKHRVHSGALHLVVTSADSLFFVVERSIRVVRESVAVLLEFGDSGLELRHRSRNVRELDNVCIRFKRELAEESEVIRHRLASKRCTCRERVCESSENAARQGDVLRLHVDIGSLCESRYNREQGLSCQERRLISKGVIDFGIHTPLR